MQFFSASTKNRGQTRKTVNEAENKKKELKLIFELTNKQTNKQMKCISFETFPDS